jgi:hypothetical protein
MAPLPPRPEPPLPKAVGVTALSTPLATPTPLPTVEPDERVLESGLRWRECPVSSLDWREGEACLGYSRSALVESGMAGAGVENGGSLLRVEGVAGDIVYQTRVWERFGLLSASLYENGQRVHTFFDRASGFPPDLSLRLAGDKVAWAYSGERVQTIAYDGRDVRTQYHLDSAYAPYELGGKLAFVGKRDDTGFLVYDGGRTGPLFERIVTAHCCEIGLYAPLGGGERYVFWGERAGSFWVVEVTPAGRAGP